MRVEKYEFGLIEPADECSGVGSIILTIKIISGSNIQEWNSIGQKDVTKGFASNDTTGDCSEKKLA